ncbi:hypothetical protein D9615_003001 [Tricholomella constricta]|uniref:PH domain-containing protein n=1 Tax=Tricholomella constricta TaxID=117010 RepID=A0A8H5HGA2_9AGAR|nr:hypothetical protein D9615_003001 [Tricholomella constricta]
MVGLSMDDLSFMRITAMSEEKWGRGEQQAFSRVSYSTASSPVEMSFPISRATSPGSLIPFRFGSRSDNIQSVGKGKETTIDALSGVRARRASMQSDHKGKEPAHGDELDGPTSPTSTSFGFGSNEPFTPLRYKSTYESSRPSTADATTKKNRGSILVAASDALGFKFGRRRPSIRQPPMPIILPDVIEISAPRRDEEDEERDRLRDMAAQSIGLPVTMKSEAFSLHESVEEVEEEAEEEGEAAVATPPADNETHDSFDAAPRSPHESSHSIVPTSPVIANRHRSRSLLAHSRTNSISPAPVPQFPATFNAINPFQQSGTMLYKYYQPSSLRIFALSKNWRHRFMVLSSPTALFTRNSGPPVSYLHLFKSSAGEDKEMERLEINEDSVVFIAEEEVGGRKHVVKVGGVDVGAMKKELNHEEGGRTMWFLHITDPAEAQKWITVIKTAILGQRTVRAGLGLPSSTLCGVEPRGDMDVMLSMRAQGLITSPTATANPRSVQNGSPSSSQQDRNYASSISSHRSQATVSRSVSSGAVSTLKGLFTGSSRPRSASRATSIDSQQDRDRDPHEDSFGSMGNHLLGNLRHNTADPTLGTHFVTTHANLPYAGSVLPPENRLERKIAIDRPILWAPSASAVELTPAKQERANRALSLGALSLQPPPRKRWTSAGPARPGPDSLVHANSEATIAPDAGPSGEAETEPPLGPSMTGFTFGTPEQRPRAPSIQSVSTLASAENNTSIERSSSSTKRSSMKRWSRQGVLPRRLTPPSGPPPSVPTNASRGGRLSIDPPPSNRSRASSTGSASSQKSFVSSLPSFSKRASGSSVLSASSLSQSPPVARPTSNHRISMPPPRPAPTSALPPAPDQDPPKSDPFPSSSSKPSFRDSVAHRAFRFSMIAPKPPPSSVLPPRPDEVQLKSHRRNSSGSYQHPTSLDSIPASPVPPPVAVSPPFPPPMGPLPPTPASSQQTSTTAPHSRPASRHISIKQRLRILSAPSPTSAASAQSTPVQPPTADILNGLPPLHRPPASTTTSTASSSAVMVASPIPLSPPATPIAEKITLYQNDPSFLQLHTPVTPHLPPPRALPTPPELYPEVTSLSPPPRRGSKQISIVGSDVESPVVEEDQKLSVEGPGEHRLISLSRPGSVVSLGIMSM